MLSFSKPSRRPSGFTLIEMMVVISIFLVVSGIVLANFKGFARRSSLDLLAREMSLAIRQAQVYGSATKRYEGSTNPSDDPFPSYGVYLAGGNLPNFYLFADKNGNGYFDGDHTSCNRTQECVEQFGLTGGAYVQDVSGHYDNGSGQSGFEPIASGVEGLDLLFQRPKLGPLFNIKCGNNTCPSRCTINYPPGSNSSQGVKSCNYDYVKITIKNPTETQVSNTRDILVWGTGHIYVESELGGSGVSTPVP